MTAVKHSTPGATQSATIMMVDDESTTLDVIQAFLEGEGYSRFLPVVDSREAVTTAFAHRPDVVLLDLMMPDVNGLEVLREMRRHPRLAHVPVVILTSSTDSETKLEALELGATDFLAKPVDPSELALRLRNTLMVKAHHDRLTYVDEATGLPNRRRFVEFLNERVTSESRTPPPLAVVHLRLGRIRQVDEALGRQASNEIVQLVATRLQNRLRAGHNALLARAGRDEFLVLLEGVDVDAAERCVRSLFSEVKEPCRVAGQDVVLAAQAGITLFPEDGRDAETLLGNAQIALQANERRDDSYLFHDESLNSESRDRLILEGHLREALRTGGLQLHYQPKVDLVTGEIVGAEALARWDHPVFGRVPPDRFIPIAEESDLIETLGEWGIRRACWQMRNWLDAGLPPIFVAVNVSSRQLRSDRLEQIIESALDENRLDGSHLVVELTESMIMDNPEHVGVILNGLKRLGVAISVDDFGTGYSSLAMLKRFPIDELKIDRSFVKGIPDDPDDCAIVAAVIAMGHALGLRLVAEGVEQEAQADFLRERGCEIYQGFLCSQPLAATDWPMLLSRLGA